jgi:hypothetical protein
MITTPGASRRPQLITHRDEGATRARRDGRAYWRLLYRGGRVVNEWDGADPWLEAPRQGREAIRLSCPDGQVATLGNEGGDASGRLLQFKVAEARLMAGPTDEELEAVARLEVSHRDGAVVQWQYGPTRVQIDRAAAALERLRHDPQVRGPRLGRRTLAYVIGLVHDDNGACTLMAWDAVARQLVGPLDDNVTHLAFHQTGPLAPVAMGR